MGESHPPLALPWHAKCFLRCLWEVGKYAAHPWYSTGALWSQDVLLTCYGQSNRHCPRQTPGALSDAHRSAATPRMTGPRKLASVMQDMETLVCRQTLAGHKHDVLCISGLQLPAFPRTDSRPSVANGAQDCSDSPAQVSEHVAAPHSLHPLEHLLHGSAT